MDEPFGALDRALRSELQAELVRMQDDVGITTVMVTHDQEEAQAVAGILVVMNEGRVEQVGTPAEIYDTPATLFVNGFIGHANRMSAVVTGPAILKAADVTQLALPRPANFLPGTAVIMTCRPEDLSLSIRHIPGAFPARFDRAVVMGRFLNIDATLGDGTPVKAQVLRTGTTVPDKGQSIWLTPDPARIQIFPSSSMNGHQDDV